MGSDRSSSDYGEEIMPTLDQVSLSTLILRHQESFVREYELAKQRFLARHSKTSQEGANNSEHTKDDLANEAISNSEAMAILQHYYGISDDQTMGAVRPQVSVEGPYFGQEESNSSIGVYSNRLPKSKIISSC